MVYGLEAKEREQKEADRFQRVSPSHQAALADVLTIIFFRSGRAVESFRHVASAGGGENTSESGSKSRGLTLSHRETPAGHMILRTGACTPE